MPSEESAEWILEQAPMRGAKFSRRQLAEWHRSGLLPTPRQTGLGRGKGSRAVYPARTLDQAVACCRLMQKMSRIEDVGWTLWTLGYPVAERFWRWPFEHAHRSFRDVQSISTEPNEPGDDSPPILSDAIELLIGKIANLPQMGLARRRLGPELLKEVLGVIASTAIGSFQRPENDPDEMTTQERLIGRLLGVVPRRIRKRFHPRPCCESQEDW